MNTELNKRKAHVSHNTGKNNEWYTPKYIIDAARKTMGKIDLDPASSDIANRTVQATTYYTKDDDGLSKPWFGNIWLNPPYAKGLIDEFILAVRNKRSEYDQAIILVNNATETRWFQDLLNVVSAICFVDKRVKFLDINGKPGSPLQGQVILYVGSNHSKFIVNFSQLGVCRIKCDLIFDINTASGSTDENFGELKSLIRDNQGYIRLGHRKWKIAQKQDCMTTGDTQTNNFKSHL